MKYYLAPLEGITGYVYRNAYAKVFGNMDKYYAPFIVANQTKKLKTREIRDILPENNLNINLIPQVLTNNSEQFISTADRVKQLGYDELNINFGCPSGTVVAKYKGSGFLSKPEELDKFLYEIFEKQEIKISIKTRIGKDEPEEFYKLLEIYNKYPIDELIIHLRTQKDFYRNTPNLDMYRYALENSTNPICYNGDLFTLNQHNKIIEKFPETKSMMIARGIIFNPGLLNEIKTGTKVSKDKLREFHDELLKGHIEHFKNDERIILCKMKEVWAYMCWNFYDCKKYAKEIRKSQNLLEYKLAVNAIFREDIDSNAYLFAESER